MAKKIEILNSLATGAGPSKVARQFGLHEATIRTIKKNEIKIRNSVAAGSFISCNVTSYTKNSLMEVMEKQLLVWIEDCIKHNKSLDSNLIKERALIIFDQLKYESFEFPESSKGFAAIKGWYKNFIRRFNLYKVADVSSSDLETDKNLKLQLTTEKYGHKRC